MIHDCYDTRFALHKNETDMNHKVTELEYNADHNSVSLQSISYSGQTLVDGKCNINQLSQLLEKVIRASFTAP